MEHIVAHAAMNAIEHTELGALVFRMIGLLMLGAITFALLCGIVDWIERRWR